MTKIKTDDPQATIKTVLQSAADNCDGSVYSDYSGRCMYGKICWGIVASDPATIMREIVLAMFEQGVDAATLPRHKIDSMGKDCILYFEDIAGDESTDEDEDDES